MDNKSIALALLIVGLVLGYLVGSNRSDSRYASIPGGMHMMNDGQDMSEMMGRMNMMLRGKTGDEFDKAFLSQMIVHHEGAVQMAGAALKDARHQEIKNMANDIISAQNREIEQMKTWQREWYYR